MLYLCSFLSVMNIYMQADSISTLTGIMNNHKNMCFISARWNAFCVYSKTPPHTAHWAVTARPASTKWSVLRNTIRFHWLTKMTTVWLGSKSPVQSAPAHTKDTETNQISSVKLLKFQTEAWLNCIMFSQSQATLLNIFQKHMQQHSLRLTHAVCPWWGELHWPNSLNWTC